MRIHSSSFPWVFLWVFHSYAFFATFTRAGPRELATGRLSPFMRTLYQGALTKQSCHVKLPPTDFTPAKSCTDHAGIFGIPHVDQKRRQELQEDHVKRASGKCLSKSA